MKQIIFILSISFLFSSCTSITGSGRIIREKRQTGDFNGISVSGGIDVELKQGTSTSVDVEADDNLVNHIETRVEGSVLKIGHQGINNVVNAHMKVYVSAPFINMLRSSSASGIEVKDVLRSDGKISLNSSSAAYIHVQVNAPEVVADASSGASLDLSGKTKTYSANSSSGANIKSSDLLSENTEASASSGGSAHVHASISLNVNASSGGHITYYGAASVRSSVSSGGSVEKGN